MKYLSWLVGTAIVLFACNSDERSASTTPPLPEAKEKTSFFPVTSFIKGQLADFRNKGINPLKYTTIGNKTDSAWLKVEEVPLAVADFLQPVIDTTNLVGLFSESKFLDQTIESYTYTYEPTGKLPDSFQLRHWDVYVDPASGIVKKIYIVKRVSVDRELKLTWEAGKSCLIITIADPDGEAAIIKEEKITWDF